MTSRRKLLMTGLAALCLLAEVPVRGADPVTQNTLVVGFTAAHFSDINQADALAAMKVWVETVIVGRGLDLKAKTVVYDDVPSLAAALRTGTPDLMILLTHEYLNVQRENLLDPMFVSVRGSSTGETYMLAVARDGPVRSPADLQGRSLVIKEGARMSLAERWLERELTNGKLAKSRALFAGITRQKNVSRALLPVFFGKADACLIAQNGYDMMSELNPQIRRKLTALVTSPSLVPSITCLRHGYESPYRGDVIDALGKLHEEPKGQQILALFGVNRLVPFKPDHLSSAIELIGDNRTAEHSEETQ